MLDGLLEKHDNDFGLYNIFLILIYAQDLKNVLWLL